MAHASNKRLSSRSAIAVKSFPTSKYLITNKMTIKRHNIILRLFTDDTMYVRGGNF